MQILIFLALQILGVSVLGSLGWLLAAIITAGILWLLGKSVMPRRTPPQLAEIWKFTTIFVVVGIAIYSFGDLLSKQYAALASVMPNASMSVFTSYALGFLLISFGAAMFVTGWTARWAVTTVVGVIWLFLALFSVAGLTNYFNFGLFTGLPFVVYGLMTKG